MASDIIVDRCVSGITSAPAKAAESVGTRTDLIRLKSLACGLKRVAHWLRGVAYAPVLDVGAVVEVQALLGLPLRTPFDEEDFLWRRLNPGVMYEPDPFATEFPFQRDMWPC